MDRIRNRLALAVAIAAALFLPCGPATAQGTLNTYACENFPAALQVRVDLLDDAEPMLRVRAALLAALARKGIPVADGAPYVLSVGAEATRLAARRKGRDLGSISDGTDEDVKMRMNLWSSREDSVLGGRKDAVESEARNEIRVTISINSIADGRCIWRGDAVHDTAGRDQWAVAERMAPILVDAIGGSGGHRAFELY